MFYRPEAGVESVELVFGDDGTPCSMHWDGQDWQVSDMPTPLSEIVSWITHPPVIKGWRFQVTPHRGASIVVDVVQHVIGGAWRVTRVWN